MILRLTFLAISIFALNQVGFSQIYSVGNGDGFGFSCVGGVGTEVPLPVTWLDFTATKQDKAVLLNWSTAQELNTLDFVVQHSTDGEIFTNVASQPAAGNSNSIQNYYYVHTSPVLGYNYYRLHQRDFNGESSYSEIRSVKLNIALNTNDVRVLGNPLQTNELTLVTPVDQEITIYTMVGQLCLEQQLEAGSHTLDVSFLPKGTYLLQTATSSQKIIKL